MCTVQPIEWRMQIPNSQLEAGIFEILPAILWENSHRTKSDNDIKKNREKSGLSRKFKVSTLDVQIKRSGLRAYNSKVPSSGVSDILSEVGLLGDKIPVNLVQTTLLYNQNLGRENIQTSRQI